VAPPRGHRASDDDDDEEGVCRRPPLCVGWIRSYLLPWQTGSLEWSRGRERGLRIRERERD